MKKSTVLTFIPVALTPDPAMLPDADIFLVTSQRPSLIALNDNTPGLLFPSPAALIAVAEHCMQREEDREEVIEYSCV